MGNSLARKRWEPHCGTIFRPTRMSGTTIRGSGKSFGIRYHTEVVGEIDAQATNWVVSVSDVADATPTRCQCHKTFYGRKLRLFIISSWGSLTSLP